VTENDTQREAEIRADERDTVAQAIAHELAVKVCGPLCEHPSCSTYRFAARIAREHAAPPRIPEQGGDPT
jgi:hypothetical protein